MWNPSVPGVSGTSGGSFNVPPTPVYEPPPPPPGVSDSPEYDINQQLEDYQQMPAESYSQFYNPFQESANYNKPSLPNKTHKNLPVQITIENETPTGFMCPWTPQQSQNNQSPIITAPVFEEMKPVVKNSSLVENAPKTPDGKVDTQSLKYKFLEKLLEIKTDEHRPYPKELVAKFTPLRCDLCSAKMNSTAQSRMHYKGKQHMKKVRMFMNQWRISNNEPEPPIKKQKIDAMVPSELNVILGTSDDVNLNISPLKSTPTVKTVSLHCYTCDKSFTSTAHAEQHYLGKSHKSACAGRDPYKNCNYFNPETGQWQKNPITKGSKNIEDITGRFGIGEAFLPAKDEMQSPIPNAVPNDPISQTGKFYCSTCNVSATCQEQLELHYKGAKHKKKLLAASQLQTNTAAPSTNFNSVATVINNSETKLTQNDAMCARTPSGMYYCSACDITLNSESQFLSHGDSKKHRLKSQRNCNSVSTNI